MTGKRFTVCCLLILFMILSYATPAMAYKSSLVYAGQGDDADADAFKAKLDSKSATWTSNTLKTNNVVGTEPYHNDLSNGADDTIGARLLYYSGHGFHDGFIPFYKKTSAGEYPPVKKTVNGTLKFDLIRFDGSWDHTNGQDRGYPAWWPSDTSPYIVGIPGNELRDADWAVGAHWLSGSSTATESHWNNNIRHVFFASCSQLNNQNDGADGYWSTWRSAAVGWARALLGSPNRAHQICGYRNSAPGDGTDTNIVNSFFTNHASYSVKESWQRANNAFSATYWAVLQHASASNDRLPGWGAADPPDATVVDLDLWTSSGQTHLNVAKASPLQKIFRFFAELFDTKQAIAGITINNPETIFRIEAVVPNSPVSAKKVITGIEERSEEDVARTFFNNGDKPERSVDANGTIFLDWTWS